MLKSVRLMKETHFISYIP